MYLSTAIPTALTQHCDQITTCVDGQPLINCSMAFQNATTQLQITVYILENIPDNSVIYCLDDDLFFPNAMYDISLGPTFMINSTIGAVVITESPNYEDATQRNRKPIITATAQNGSSTEAMLIVNVINVNEFLPVLSGNSMRSFVLTEGEGKVPSPYVLQVRDNDTASRPISYNITGTGSEDFKVTIEIFPPNILTTLTYVDGLSLDRERFPMYQLTIIAVDNVEPVRYSNPLNINITVLDINDNAPQFTNNRTFIIPTVLPAGEFVGIASASDLDDGENGTITYSIINVMDVELEGEGELQLFRIDSANSTLYTTATYAAERTSLEPIRNISVEIMAKDNGNVPMNSTATFVIILQRPPQFHNSSYMFQLRENIGEIVTVGFVNASFSDDISMRLFYKVEPTAARSKFTVDSDTGEIRALVSLDREASETETFTVTAVGEMDQRLTSNATVVIKVLDQNDEHPQFGRSHYSFMIKTGMRVAGRVSATDNDIGDNSVVTFAIETSTSLDIPVNISNIGNNEAEIIVTDQTVSDARITFTIVATDRGGLENSAIVTVEIAAKTSTDDGNDIIIVIVAVVVSILVILFILLIIIYLCWRRYRSRSGKFSVRSKNTFNGFASTDPDYVPTRKKSILKVPTGENGKYGSPSCSEAASERVKFEPRANMVMFELDQPTIRKEASITTDTKLGSGDDSSICSGGHNKHVDRDEGLILRSSKNPPLTRTTLSSNITDSDDDDEFPSIARNQLYTASNLRTQPAQPAPIGVANHTYSPPLTHRYDPVSPIVHHQTPIVDGTQMLSSENLDKHNRAMAKRHRKVPSDQYSETSDGTGTYFTSDAEDGSAYGEPPGTWTTL